MIELKNLGHGFLRKTLFEGVNLTLRKNERYGIVGANGCGKSTLLKIIAGEMDTDDGQVEIAANTSYFRIGQDHSLPDDLVIIDTAMMGQLLVYNAIKRQEELLKSGASDLETATELARLEELIHNHEGYRLRSKAAAILEGLGIACEYHEQELKTLSGGFKWRVSLAQALIKKPDTLMLDEPTNHLDIISIGWLEGFLASYEGCVLLVSHDKRFVDNVVTRVLDIDFNTIKEYVGNYRSFEKARRLFLLQKEKEIEAQEKEVAKKQAFVERFRYKASKARQAQSRLKQIEKIVIDAPLRTSRIHPKFLFAINEPSSKEVLKVDRLNKSYGAKNIIENFSLEVRRGDKIAIIGPNGTGKSTLIKALAMEFSECKKAITWGHGVVFGYFAQDCGAKMRAFDHSLLEWLWQFCADKPQSFVQGMLGRVLFSGEDSKKSVKDLSGGELGRLYLAYIMIQKPNVLLLDEPTNHLDLEAIESLSLALSDYEGTLITVSHDRTFLDLVAKRIVAIEKTGLNDFLGTYSEFVQSQQRDYLDIAQESALSRQNKKPDTPFNNISYEEKKKRKAQSQKLKKHLEKIILAVEDAEKNIEDIDKLFLAPDFYDKNNHADVARLEQQRNLLKNSLAELIEEWSKTEEELALFTDE